MFGSFDSFMLQKTIILLKEHTKFQTEEMLWSHTSRLELYLNQTDSNSALAFLLYGKQAVMKTQGCQEAQRSSTFHVQHPVPRQQPQLGSTSASLWCRTACQCNITAADALLSHPSLPQQPLSRDLHPIFFPWAPNTQHPQVPSTIASRLH